MSPTERDFTNRFALYRRLLIAGICVAAIGLCILYLKFEPSSGLYPRCMFKMLTGLSCPGCGSQRAIHAIFHGDIKEAFSYNALFIIEIPLLALLIFSRLIGSRYPQLQRTLSSRFFILFILVTIIIWTIIRNIFHI